MQGYLQPLPLHQGLEASDGPAGRIQDDLSQWGHLQGGVRSFCAVNENWSPLPETNKTVCDNSSALSFSAERRCAYSPDLTVKILLTVYPSFCTGPGLIWKGSVVPWPVDTLGSQAGGGEDLLDVSLPAGSL